MAEQVRRERNERWERRFQSFAVSIAAGGVLWFGATLVELKTGAAKLEQRVDGIDVAMSAKYARSDAKRDYDELRGRIDGVSGRVTDTEARVGRLEAATPASVGPPRRGRP